MRPKSCNVYIVNEVKLMTPVNECPQEHAFTYTRMEHIKMFYIQAPNVASLRTISPNWAINGSTFPTKFRLLASLVRPHHRLPSDLRHRPQSSSNRRPGNLKALTNVIHTPQLPKIANCRTHRGPPQ